MIALTSRIIYSHLNKGIKLLGDSDHHVVVDKVPLGRGQGPLAAGLPALGCRAAEEGNLHQDIKFLVPSLHYTPLLPGATSAWGHSPGTAGPPRTRRRWWCPRPWPAPCPPARRPRSGGSSSARRGGPAGRAPC